MLLFHRKLSPSVITTCADHGVPIVMRISDYLFMCPKMTFYRDGTICEKCMKSKLFSIKYKCVKHSAIASLLWFLADKYHHMTKIYDRVDEFVLTNPFMKQKMIEYGYTGCHNIIESFSARNEYWRKSAFLKMEKKQFCYTGNIFEHKGVDLLIFAFAEFRKADPEYHLIIMGNDYDDVISGMKASDPDLFENVLCYPHSSMCNVLEVLSDSMYSFAPAKWYENLPNAIIESFSVGTPVIATHVGSLEFMVQEGINGYLFEYNDKKSLIEKMKQAVDIDEQSYSVIQSNCIRDIDVKYNQKIHYEKLMRVFNRAITSSK